MNGRTSARGLSWLLIVAGSAGLVASFILIVEKLHLLEQPSAILSCDIGPFVACGPVMKSTAASLFGFPNPIIGLVGFTVVITTGVAVVAGARFPRWYWASLAIGTVLAGVFITWLQFQSIVMIGSLCAWCMIVWAATIPLVAGVVGHSLGSEGVGGSALRAPGNVIWRYRVSIVAIWYLIVIAAIVITFYEDFLLLL